jgi:hypothetical protein
LIYRKKIIALFVYVRILVYTSGLLISPLVKSEIIKSITREKRRDREREREREIAKEIL